MEAIAEEVRETYLVSIIPATGALGYEYTSIEKIVTLLLKPKYGSTFSQYDWDKDVRDGDSEETEKITPELPQQS